MDIFATTQEKDEGIDNFLYQKRLLLDVLPAKRHKEKEQIDLINGFIDARTKKTHNALKWN